jgi:Peptidase family M13
VLATVVIRMIMKERLKFLFIVVFLTLFRKAVNQQVCTTDVCYKESENIKSKMDTSVSPCEDFYQFSCGKFKPEIPKEKTSINQFTLLQDELLIKLNMSMSEKPKESDIEPVKNVKKFYRACMNKGMLI